MNYVYSANVYMVESSDITSCTYMQIHPLCMAMKDMACLCNLAGTFVCGTYMAITCEEDATVEVF